MKGSTSTSRHVPWGVGADEDTEDGTESERDFNRTGCDLRSYSEVWRSDCQGGIEV